MDWRDSHLQGDKQLKEGNLKLPTFLYAMPFSANHIFLEETSLVARPGVPMDIIQKRMELRLKHLGIHVRSIEEDEHCVIPMGGVLPVVSQRVLGIGGSAGMVHPSTGYVVARTLAAAPMLADSVIQGLGSSSSSHVPSRPQAPQFSTSSQQLEAPSDGDVSGPNGDELAAGVWADLGPLKRQQQRAFSASAWMSSSSSTWRVHDALLMLFSTSIPIIGKVSCLRAYISWSLLDLGFPFSNMRQIMPGQRSWQLRLCRLLD